MKIVITGARGFIGMHLARRLTKSGHAVIGLTRCDKEDTYRAIDIQTGNGIDSTQASLARHISGSDAVVHLAARQVASLSEPLQAYIPSNIVLTEDIARIVSESGVPRLVFASSRLVYPGWCPDVCTETCPHEPDTMYGLSKRVGEDLLRIYARKYNWTSVSLRLGQIFGPDPKKRGVVFRFIEQARTAGKVTVFGQGLAVRDFIYLEDVLSAFEAALVSEAASGAYNIGSSRGYSVCELATAVSTAFLDGKVNVEHKHVENEDQTRYVMDCHKALRDMNWQPQWTLTEALRDMRDVDDGL
ncbi:NAD-dependent epimerase/dehydratase family protein [Desulfolutivibrio sulfoxidireducens]|uniref:NAD-dependent epimerase/dehydratase family protein n=1 Tax=Desulfolutivibrio sulfoxidireducens TaxID=2773299 RepID=UPI00159D38B2|nr:NAD(P)-dependent oxidoreductase [Desulfolutivibrio sulfoxidireducens]QLA14919.1 NAD-dependent epimerase/dehydratase family protein [Desulfolutivibrio sulfoxidireducens]QLA18485.1 NAD-dependent epimerase/dehydratase family protein [Desulfolutivibrio sulfoxidireducens]